ncbi:hypothetical protein [Halorubrum sp. SP9]|uniref:hypothetical protein n=1 Tax=Halorubrum sp. SP9 TaxID=1537267 RepID=UPI0010F548C2|nr:hypothetical protein [Halorubrum sp. SP9]TKX68565.1 hypothetical protein EXE45_11285 [Halorubrum sp. SP9]
MSEEEPDAVVDEAYTSVEQLNEKLPDGVWFDEDSKKLHVHGETYDINSLVNTVKSRAKERGPATFGLTVGGVTVALAIAGPVAGAAAATTGSIVGALYDKGYIEFVDGKIKFNMDDETEYIESGEEAKMDDPLEVHSDKWYEPDSDTYSFAIELANGEKRYYKTEEGAANRLIDEYGI